MSTITATDLRKLASGWDPASGQWVHRGLDLSSPTTLTAEEVAAFKGHYAGQFGKADDGLNWWLDNHFEVLKRYRLYCSLTLRVDPCMMGNGTLAFYMLNGYEPGVRYVVSSWQQQGVSKAQMLEIIAMAFVHAGPRGMRTLVKALEDYSFEEAPSPPCRFPDGWASDIDAFKSGLDFSNPWLSPAEKSKLYDWYLRTLGEIPPYAKFLADHRPSLIKTHRARIENMLYVLPKQMWPTSQLYYNVMTRCAEGIRENVLLCKAWSVTKADTLDVIGNALVYGQMEGASMVQREAGDVFDGWADA
ncbi:MAG: hypothetical protein AB1429_14905 [Pseudomonadota bacterium]|jgi:hypothetical protein